MHSPAQYVTTLNNILTKRYVRTYTSPRSNSSFRRLCSIIEQQLEILNIKRQLLRSDSGDDRQLPLTCIQHFLEQVSIHKAANADLLPF